MLIIKNRYEIIKGLYEDYLILLIKRDKYISFNRDKNLLEYLHFETLKDLEKLKINYLVLDNLEIVNCKNYNDDNKYQEYLVKSFLGNIIKIVKARMI